MAEEAAQAAAMQAYEEALRAAQQDYGQSNDAAATGGLAPAAAIEAAAGFDPALLMEGGGGMEMVEPLHLNHLEGQPQQGQQQVDMLQELMGIPGTNLDENATAHQLMQVIEHQRQQQQATLAAAEEALQMRPEKHYLTISQDGKLERRSICYASSM